MKHNFTGNAGQHIAIPTYGHFNQGTSCISMVNTTLNTGRTLTELYWLAFIFLTRRESAYFSFKAFAIFSCSLCVSES